MGDFDAEILMQNFSFKMFVVCYRYCPTILIFNRRQKQLRIFRMISQHYGLKKYKNIQDFEIDRIKFHITA